MSMQTGPALTLDDFALYAKHPGKPSVNNIPPEDKEHLSTLPPKVRAIADFIVAVLTVETPLRGFSSHPFPNGHVPTDCWGCVYPLSVGNKSWAFQLFFIVGKSGIEYGFGSGAGTGQIKDPANQAAFDGQLAAAKARLAALPTEARDQMAAVLEGNGFKLRGTWRAPDAPTLKTLNDWITFATSPEHDGAAISALLPAAEAVALGPGLAEELAHQLQPLAPLMDAAYVNTEAVPPAPKAGAASGPFDVESLRHLAFNSRGLRLGDSLYASIIAALEGGKHVILTGAPGTAKTTLAYVVAELAQRTGRCLGYVPTTATADWTTFETIGGLRPTGDGGLEFAPGHFLEAIQGSRWLIIDELNRANLDRAFGALFTVLSGQTVMLPYKDPETAQQIALVREGDPSPSGATVVTVPRTWRIIATMNVFDKSLLFEMSYALMRRFAFIEVPVPPAATFGTLIASRAAGDASAIELATSLLELNAIKSLGPSIYMDIASYAAARNNAAAVSREDLAFEAFYAFLLPQFEGIDDEKGQTLLAQVRPLVGPANGDRLRKALTDVLGVRLATPRRKAEPDDSEDESA